MPSYFQIRKNGSGARSSNSISLPPLLFQTFKFELMETLRVLYESLAVGIEVLLQVGVVDKI
jgi:hypothetical protein